MNCPHANLYLQANWCERTWESQRDTIELSDILARYFQVKWINFPGNTIGTYSVDELLVIGARIVFCDMAIYTMLKNSTFNGMPLLAIIASDEDGSW